MFDKLDAIEEKYEEVTRQLSGPELLADQQQYTKATKQHRELGELVEKYREYKALDEGLRETKEMLDTEDDLEMVALARTEMTELEARRAQVEADLRMLLIPKDPNDEKNVILEIDAVCRRDHANVRALR
jgi:peptide chain release factor 1